MPLGRRFKERKSELKHALNHRQSTNRTALSDHVWSERDNGEKPVVHWCKLHQAPKPNIPQNICTLYYLERNNYRWTATNEQEIWNASPSDKLKTKFTTENVTLLHRYLFLLYFTGTVSSVMFLLFSLIFYVKSFIGVHSFTKNRSQMTSSSK